jgi:hypothetical protein
VRPPGDVRQDPVARCGTPRRSRIEATFAGDANPCSSDGVPLLTASAGTIRAGRSI